MVRQAPAPRWRAVLLGAGCKGCILGASSDILECLITVVKWGKAHGELLGASLEIVSEASGSGRKRALSSLPSHSWVTAILLVA